MVIGSAGGQLSGRLSSAGVRGAAAAGGLAGSERGELCRECGEVGQGQGGFIPPGCSGNDSPSAKALTLAAAWRMP